VDAIARLLRDADEEFSEFAILEGNVPVLTGCEDFGVVFPNDTEESCRLSVGQEEFLLRYFPPQPISVKEVSYRLTIFGVGYLRSAERIG
jgi:hypothetical protein